MICPVCGLELGVERQAGEVVLTYSIGDWVQSCTYQRGDPALCAHLMPAILKQLPGQATPSDHAPRRSDASIYGCGRILRADLLLTNWARRH